MVKGIRRAAGFVIYRRNCDKKIEYLLLQASYANFHWTPPKGHLEPNETNLDAAVRETEEEAGIKMKDLDVNINFERLLTYEPRDKPFTKQVTYWLARLVNPATPVVLSREHKAYEWLSLAQAKERTVYPEMQKLLDDCEIYITKHNA